MSDDIKKENAGSTDVLAKIERLESLLREKEGSRKQGLMIARLSVLAILIALCVFAWNLYGVYRNFTSESNMLLLKEQIVADIGEIAKGPDVRMIERKIINEIVPKVSDIFIARFKKELPMFKDVGYEFLGNMKNFAETHIKEELTRTLDESMKDIEKDLQMKFPDLSPEKLQQTMTAAQHVFVEDITDHLEQSLVDLSGMFDGLYRTIGAFRETEDYKVLVDKELDDVKLGLVEALLELAIYEVNPLRGEKKYKGDLK